MYSNASKMKNTVVVKFNYHKHGNNVPTSMVIMYLQYLKYLHQI